jgi:hypothetical protein
LRPAPASRWKVFLLAWLACVVSSAVARADPTLVVLAGPPPSAPAPEVVNRLHGELVADGFTVLVRNAVSAPDRPAAVLRAAREGNARVAAGIFVEGPDGAVELVLVDTLVDRTSRVRPPTTVDAAEPEVFARRTVDFLRANFLDFVVESLRASTPPASVRHEAPANETVRPSPPAPLVPANPVQPSPPSSRWALEAGAASLFSFQGVGPSVAPLLRARFEPTRRWTVRLTASWPSTRPTVRNASGSAEVEQGVALAEGVVTLWSVPPLQLRASLGIGAYYVAVDGAGVAPHQGQRNSTFAAAIDAGLGVAVPLATHFEAVLEAHALASEPGIAVRFLDTDAARVGRPTVLATLTFGAWL